MWWHVVNCTMYAYSYPYRSDSTWHNFNTLSMRIFSRGHYRPLSKYALIPRWLISAGSIELTFGGTYFRISVFQPKTDRRTIQYYKKTPYRRDPPSFPADHVKLFIRCVAIPTYLRLTVSYSYLEITVLVTFSFVWAVSRSAMRFRYDPETSKWGF